MKIGERIKLLRSGAGMTLEEVGEKVGTSKQTINRYETGEIANIPADKIEKLAMVFKTTPAAIMGWEIESKTEDEVHYISEDHKSVINAISELNAKDLQYVMDLVKRLNENNLRK